MDQTIDLPAFQNLLQRLENGDVSIRLRLLGEPWTKFSRLILLSESAMIVQDSDDRKTIINILLEGIQQVIQVHVPASLLRKLS